MWILKQSFYIYSTLNPYMSCRPEELLNVILSRRSIRRFKPDPVPDDLVEKILEAGIRAPTAGGCEQWLFIVVKSEERKRRIHELLLEAHKKYAVEVAGMPPDKVEKWMTRIREGMYFAPLYIVAYLDLRRRCFTEAYRDYEKLEALKSLSAAVENIILAAHALGLGAVWLGVPVLMADEFNKALEPPPGAELHSIIALGYPAEEPRPRPRRPLSEVVLYR